VERRFKKNVAPPQLIIAGSKQVGWERSVRFRQTANGKRLLPTTIPPSLLGRVDASGLLWDRERIKQEQRASLLALMTPKNLRRWGSYTAARAELQHRGYNRVTVKVVLRGRWRRGPSARYVDPEEVGVIEGACKKCKRANGICRHRGTTGHLMAMGGNS
jgi:hypothetical protein